MLILYEWTQYSVGCQFVWLYSKYHFHVPMEYTISLRTSKMTSHRITGHHTRERNSKDAKMLLKPLFFISRKEINCYALCQCCLSHIKLQTSASFLCEYLWKLNVFKFTSMLLDVQFLDLTSLCICPWNRSFFHITLVCSVGKWVLSQCCRAQEGAHLLMITQALQIISESRVHVIEQYLHASDGWVCLLVCL